MDAPPAIVIQHDLGGQLGDYIDRYGRYERGGLHVEFRSECYSSCTILVGLPNVCVGRKAVLGFHEPVQQFPGREPTQTGGMFYGSKVMMLYYPKPVRQWVVDNGSLTKKIIYLEGAELAAIVPKCKDAK